MDYIRVTKENIDKEHICCAINISTLQRSEAPKY